MSDHSRFNAKVDRDGECWLWTGSRNREGYGRFRFGGENRLAHRVAWELAHGPIPRGLIVMHSCDTPPCVRLDHLSLGTPADNAADMVAKGRSPREPNRRRLTDAQVAEIRRRVAAGESRADVGRSFGVHGSYVGRLAANQRRAA